MNIVSIGNSFSEDAQRYLHRIAKADNVVLNTYNVSIGGCPLSRHYRNMLGDNRDYYLDFNGQSTGFFVTLKEGLLNRNWDVVTIQQVSHEAPYYDTYQPYLEKLVEYIRLCVPKAKIAIQQTWAYEEGSKRLTEELGYTKQIDMFNDIEASYKKAAQSVNADFIIPSGELLQKLLANGIEKVHRDTFHASLGVGRYAIGLLWYALITGNSIKDNTFSDFDVEVTKEEIEIAKKCVMEICGF